QNLECRNCLPSDVVIVQKSWWIHPPVRQLFSIMLRASCLPFGSMCRLQQFCFRRLNRGFRLWLTVEADTQPEQTREKKQVGAKVAEDRNVDKDFDDKQTEDSRVGLPEARVAVLVIVVQIAQAGGHKPGKSDHAKKPKRNDEGKRAAMIIARDHGARNTGA